MRTVSQSEAQQRLPSVLNDAQQEPVIVQNENRDVAVILSMDDYKRMRLDGLAAFQRFCDQVGERATAEGLDEAELEKLLAE